MSQAQGNMIKGNTGDWEIVIGLEVHAQVTSNSKLFSGASTKFGNEPNTNVSFIDAGMPGMLPVINEVAIGQAVRTGLAINAQVNLRSVFDRKNYFYPDLPHGFKFNRLMQEADRVDVLDFATRTQRRTRLTHRHVSVAAHIAFFHIAIAGADIAHDSAQFFEIGDRFIG